MTSPSKPPPYRPATQLIHAGQTRSPHGETAEALYMSSGYVYENCAQAHARFKGDAPGYIYSRYGNPTVSMFEARMMALEGAQAARATASGMAAVSAALLCCLKQGDHVVAARALFGSCRFVIEEILPRYGIEVSFIDGEEDAAWAKAAKKNTRVFFLETPSNPRLDIVALEAAAKAAHNVGALLMVDNVFATPILQKPLAFGADVVIYSATKHIDGQGRALGGIVLGEKAFITETLEPFLRNTGPSLSPFNAWLLLKGLETLSLRVDAQSSAALALAQWLEGQKEIERVFYPGLPSHPNHNLAMAQMNGQGGTLLAFEVKGGQKQAFALADALTLIRISNNLGDAKSLIVHPATTTHYRVGAKARREMKIGDTLLRLSVGLEDVEDLKADLKTGLSAMRRA